MIKVFIDTSVILAASKSKTGGSSYVFMLCRKGTIQGYISRYVIYEAKKNSSLLLSQQEKRRFNFLLLECNLKLVNEPDEVFVRKYYPVIEKKDAPIAAAAKQNNVHYLLTLDTKDFMRAKLKSLIHPVQTATPHNFIKRNILNINDTKKGKP